MSKSIPLDGKKILLVEDDIFFSSIIEGKLNKAGCEFRHAVNGEDALEALSDYQPDVILLDILFPGGMDGFQVLEKLKVSNKLKKIPVIILSNMGELKDIERGMNLGAYRYIVKASIVPDEIVKHVESAIESTVR